VVTVVDKTEPKRSLFATHLTERRKAKPNLTRGALATAIGVEEKHYARYELGHIEPNFKTLLAICRELGCTPNDLLLD
jgi:DNA-binding Xre family transcriptional regulator